MTHYFLFLVFFFHAVKATLYAVYIWQLKEYRFDRIRSHITTSQGKKWVFSPFNVFGWIMFIMYGAGVVSVLPLLLLYTVELIYALKKRVFKAPIFTTKAIFAVFVGILFSLSALVVSIWMLPLQIIIFDKVRAVIIALTVFLLNRITNVHRQQIISKAQRLIQKREKVKKIGITGSYGKTSTKEFLATILSQKYAVSKTPDMVNTDIGIAQSILATITDTTDIFIAEMGAYKKGEINKIAHVVRPTIGIITGINEQHIELFTSINAIQQAKFELIASLPTDGIAIFNNSDARVHPLIAKAQEKSHLRVLTYGFDDKNDVYADAIRIKKDSISFKLHIGKQHMMVDVPVIGKQCIPNILAASCAAYALECSLKDIANSLHYLKPPTMTMAKAGEYNGATLINDTFNANADGVKAAIDYMQIYAGKKVLILTPLIELGKYAKDIHTDIGTYAAKYCDNIFLTNANYYTDITASLTKKEQEKYILLTNKSMQKQLSNAFTKTSIAIFEGKEAKKALHYLLHCE